ncbi:hypothetical protein [Methanobrevibacter filiformis]|uniref:PIN domain-containing protein n=1 Tax=Methanobrevibacter filiformis TaxID=55758 RepID=A0A166CJ81_9EURY|nr:hypothetical protein [Methanobrevibacter filiformis]KZX14570.1 hypothetical protein MBFIL_08440 [Methanobrevibacter filiformis]
MHSQLKQKKKMKNIGELKKIYKIILDTCFIFNDYPYYDIATEEYFNNELGFYDSMYIALVRKLEFDGIVSFDKHFSNRGINKID